MSRVGKEKIELKNLKKYSIDNNVLTVEGSLGTNKIIVPNFLKISVEDNVMEILLEDKTEKHHVSMHGTIVRLIKNLVTGVTVGFSKVLLFKGLGYKYTLESNNRVLNMQLGYSHGVTSRIPDDITAVGIKHDKLELKSIKKDALGEYAAQLLLKRKWNPYSGKGVMIENTPQKSKEVVKSKK